MSLLGWLGAAVRIVLQAVLAATETAEREPLSVTAGRGCLLRLCSRADSRGLGPATAGSFPQGGSLLVRLLAPLYVHLSCSAITVRVTEHTEWRAVKGIHPAACPTSHLHPQILKGVPQEHKRHQRFWWEPWPSRGQKLRKGKGLTRDTEKGPVIRTEGRAFHHSPHQSNHRGS